jgi:ketosteroid isomerase-like protein
MSQENVELQYQANDAFNRRDIDAFLALFDPDIELARGGKERGSVDGATRWPPRSTPAREIIAAWRTSSRT